MAIETNIMKALQKAAIASANSVDATIKFKPMGITFNPPADKPWIEYLHFPNNIDNEFWGREKTFRGFFRLLLHWPLDSQGAYPAMDKISAISAPFHKGAIFTSDDVSVKIYEEPDLTGVIEAPPYMIFPVTVRYMSFQP